MDLKQRRTFSPKQIGRAIEATEHVLAARLNYTGRRKLQVNN